MSGNEDGVKMVRYAASQIENLCPQVINAARILAARPKSKVSGRDKLKFYYLSVCCSYSILLCLNCK